MNDAARKTGTARAPVSVSPEAQPVLPRVNTHPPLRSHVRAPAAVVGLWGALVAGAGCGAGSGTSPSGTDAGARAGEGIVDGAADQSGYGSLLQDVADLEVRAGNCVPDPGNYDIPGNQCDDDGDGIVDNTILCDQGLQPAGTAHDFANALGLCQDANGAGWGIVSAAYTRGFAAGSPNDGQHGILTKFGTVIRPREGSSLGVLSSGHARECDDATITDCSGSGTGAPYFKGPQEAMVPTPAAAPQGYPKPAAGCTQATQIWDAIGVELRIRVPKNAQGFRFDFDFFSGEWPEYVCNKFNDSFLVWLQSAAYPGSGGDLNISFDSMGNPVSVNNGFFDRCSPNTPTGCAMGMMATGTAVCPGGTAELEGTGFFDVGAYCPRTTSNQSSGGGATGWLTTLAPANPGEEITLHFVIWDAGDASYDSSVLLDNFQWQPGPTQTVTGRLPL